MGAQTCARRCSIPRWAADVRVRVIDALAPRLHLAREVRNFLAVLLRHDRMSAIEEIVAEYRAEVDRRQGISEVEVISARRLDADERSSDGAAGGAPGRHSGACPLSRG